MDRKEKGYINRGKHFRRQGGDKGAAYFRSKARGSKRVKEERGKMGFRGKDIDAQAKDG